MKYIYVFYKLSEQNNFEYILLYSISEFVKQC